MLGLSFFTVLLVVFTWCVGESATQNDTCLCVVLGDFAPPPSVPPPPPPPGSALLMVSITADVLLMVSLAFIRSSLKELVSGGR